jgi:XTP/dITP diphosphohydrolase
MSKSKELVFATHNANKVREIQTAVGDKLNLLTLEDIGCLNDIEETGLTIEANATIKSKFVYQTYGFNCFADDTGLEVEALNQSPGVYSARYAGSQKNDSQNIDLLLSNLKGVYNRKARFRTVISLIMDGSEYFFEGVLKGNITTERIGTKGFGYDAIFMPLGLNQTLAQLDITTKSNISHRGIAITQLIAFLSAKT